MATEVLHAAAIDQAETRELAWIPGTTLEVSRVGLGTWAIGGWMWGGTDEAESIATIRAAIEQGSINLIDTAPVYGFGRSEEIVGKAIAGGNLRSRVRIATKVGLEWQGGKAFRNASRARILNEIDASLRRLRTDHIDIYQVHWPDPLVPIEETAETMRTLFEQGKIGAIGVSNFSVEQMEEFRRIAPLQFQEPRFTQYLAAVQGLDRFAQQRFGKRVIHLALRWMLDQGITTGLWGARHPVQLQPVDAVNGWSLDPAAKAEIDRILAETITDPVGPEFMAPAARSIATP
jgi:aryl-alcohol dehydrogenase-like predicted oxidoreductase